MTAAPSPSAFGSPRGALAVLTGAGLILSACVAFWAVRGDQTGNVPAFLLTFGLAFTACLAGTWASEFARLSPRAFRAALGAALLWRLVLAFAPPLLSNDVNRHVWEGRIQLHGGNPYAWDDRPNAPKWAFLRDEVYAGLNHEGYTAVYPPLWQLAAAGVVFLHDSVSAMKLFLVACEVLTLLALLRLLDRRGLPRERLLLWAWSPLALVEIAGGGHNEAFGLLFLVFALLALQSGRPLLAALASALGFQAKFLPGLLAASSWRRFRPRQVLAAATLAAVLILPYWDAKRTLLLSLGKYAQYWRFNETLFAPLAAVLGHAGAVRLGAGLAVLLAVGLGARKVEPVRAAFLVAAAVLLLSPNVLPWYALWLLPFVVLLEAPAALLYTGTVALAYLVYPAWQSGERWHLSWGIRALEYGPPGLALLAAWLRRRTKNPLTQGPDRP